MEIKSLFSIASSLLVIAAVIPFIVTILRDRHNPTGYHPPMVTWTIWAGVDLIVVFSMLAKGAVSGLVIGGAIGAVIVAALSLKYGECHWEITDKICFGGAILGGLIALIRPELGLVVSNVVLFIGGCPTFKKAYLEPKKESLTIWSIFAASCVLGVLAVSNWTIAGALGPVTYLIIDGLIWLILFVPWAKRLATRMYLRQMAKLLP
jgi:hypothetical protein